MLNKLINQLIEELDTYWDDLVNIGYVQDPDSVYFTAQEIQELGVGGVFIPNINGKLRWFDLDSMSF